MEETDKLTLVGAGAGVSGSIIEEIENRATPDQVNTQCDTALTDYDAPTKSEMDARTLPSGDYFDPASDTVGTVTTVSNMRGTDSAATAAALATVGGNVDSILADTVELTGTVAQPGQGNPPVPATLASMVAYLYKAFRNKLTETSTTQSLYNDDGDTVDQKSTVEDNGTTYTRGEIVSGP